MGRRAPTFRDTPASTKKPVLSTSSDKNSLFVSEGPESDDEELIPTSILMARFKQTARKTCHGSDVPRAVAQLIRRDNRIEKRRQQDSQPGPSTSKKIKQEFGDGSKNFKPIYSTDLKGDLSTVVTVTTRGLKAEDKPRSAVLHVNPLRTVSPVLHRQAIQAAESGSNTLELLRINADAFATFAGWVHNRRVEFGATGRDTVRDAGNGQEVVVVEDKEEGDILGAVLESYTLAIGFGAIAFGNAVVRRACEISVQHGLVFGTEIICAIYERTKAKVDQGGLLRRWIVDEWVWQFDAANVGSLVWREDKGLPGSSCSTSWSPRRVGWATVERQVQPPA